MSAIISSGLLDGLEWLAAGFTTKQLDSHYTESHTKNVEQHLAALSDALGLSGADLITVSQQHSDNIIIVTASDVAQLSSRNRIRSTPADGLITRQQGLLLCVKVADCVPILLADTKNRIVAAIHAGWRGIAKSIAKKAVERMVSYGAEAHHITAVIGPHICKEHYIVDDKVITAIKATVNDTSLIASVIKGDSTSRRQYKLSLAAAVEQQLTAAGVLEERIETLPQCTYEDPQLFHSYRRDRRLASEQVGFIGII